MSEPALLIMTELKMIIRHLRLVEYAREVGLTPILVFSRTDTEPRLRELMADPNHPLSGLGRLCPVADPSVTSVLAGVRDAVEHYDVRGALSCGEYYVTAAGALCELLGLPGTGWTAATVSRDKLAQRYLLADWAPPHWRVVAPADRTRVAGLDWDWGGPLVVKPVSRMSSSGVCLVRTPDELTGVLAEYPPTEVLLVEHCVSGAEYSVETLVQQGNPVWHGITRKATDDGGGHFVETGHTLPADDLTPAQATQLAEANTAVLARLGVRDAVTHAEYRLTESGVVLMEVALRVPGGGISALWGLATGSSLEERIVDIAVGRPVRYPAASRRVRHRFLDHPQGTLVDVRGPGVSWTVRDDRWPPLASADAMAAARVCAVLVSKVAGDRLGPLVDGDARAVSVIVDAPLAEDVDGLAERAAAEVQIVVA